MATRYTAEVLLFLRDSPLCLKPTALPPTEEWMGQSPESFRSSQGTEKAGKDRSKNGDVLVDQTNRRQGAERHAQRNSANPEDIILGPPRTTFSSATLGRGNKPLDNDKTFKDSDRFATFRRNGEGEPDRFRDRERGDRDRDGRNNFRRRGDADQDSEGWSTVKPRKSFGHEGAERFHGRMGGDRTERFGPGERRTKEVQDENAEKAPRRSNFGEFGRDKEAADDGERPRRNGLNRNRSDQPSWARGHNGENDAPAPRERFDRGKSWRERDPDAHADEKPPRERNMGRWDRDQRQEREPEWLDEAPEDKPQGRTAEDIQKFLASMKAGQNAAASAKAEPTPTPSNDSAIRDAALETEQSKAKLAPAVELGPDKFFANFAPTPPADVVNVMETPKEAPPSKAKTGSRFQGFFASQEVGRQSEPSTPAAPPPPVHEPHSLLAALASPAPKQHPHAGPGNHPDAAEKLAFDALIQKLHKQSLSVGTPPSGGFPAPPPSGPEKGPQNSLGSPGPYALFGQEPRDEPLSRGIPPQELHAQRMPQAVPHPIIRTEQQLLQDLIGQRHPMANQPAGRGDQNQSRNSNSNAEFLMNLMQSGRNPPPEPQRAEPLLRMPQPSRPAPIPQTPDREPDFQRERSASQHHGRPQGPPGFFDEPQLHHEQDTRRQQPTQILQRQVPPGLDQMHPSWLQGGNQQLPPVPGRPMIPPPGLAGNPRNGPLPGMFPPNFPMGGFPPEAMAGPPRNMPPPPGFFNGPPPGFMPPPGMGGGFHGGPEIAFGFDGRAMPPPGAANFRRN